ncbi:hypothetical protein BHM03_00016768 [Ensete ventricosum]|uniref:Uncharacterized protein n=1 Tax=Ensete ventricosum TaxID=4639 RepID=A0A427B021_ENSVE|nr:hypothetical protein B296_00021131 [Ensete ventricosum]RZR89106.1 hypothetical protein BHM03_00016768 [Ensete ventricosum]
MRPARFVQHQQNPLITSSIPLKHYGIKSAVPVRPCRPLPPPTCFGILTYAFSFEVAYFSNGFIPLPSYTPFGRKKSQEIFERGFVCIRGREEELLEFWKEALLVGNARRPWQQIASRLCYVFSSSHRDWGKDAMNGFGAASQLTSGD